MATEITIDRLRLSFLTLRRVLGVLGIALPALLAVRGFTLCGCLGIQTSISSYYHLEPDAFLGTRAIFVGVLFAIAWFLFAYRGHDGKDDAAGYLACVFALGVALFPSGGEAWVGTVHAVSMAGLFLVLAYFCWFLFTQTKPGVPMSPRKRLRNKIYQGCALLMLAWLALIAGYSLFLRDTAVADINPIFWLESLLLWTFGVSWFIKGDTLARDTQP